MRRNIDAFESMAQSLDTLYQLLGATLHDIIRIDARHVVKPAFGSERHRLAVIVRSAEESLASKDSPSPTINIVAAAELDWTVGLLQRWVQDPTWPEVFKSLKDPGTFVHDLIVRLTADAFSEHRVTLNPTRSGERSADLFVECRDGSTFFVEVKCPRELQRPDLRLGDTLADELLRKLVKKAGEQIGSGGGDASTLLVLGGFYLGRKDLELLEHAITGYFCEKWQRRRHMVGVMVTTTVLLANVPGGNIVDESSILGPGRIRDVDCIVRAQLTLNKDYAGPVKLAGSFHRPSPKFETAREMRL